MSKKGVELPVNVLVIVAIAVIVLLGLIAMYMAGTGGSGAQFNVLAEKNYVCSQIVNRNCVATDCDDVKARDGTTTAEQLADNHFGGDGTADCLEMCGCSVL